MTRGIAGGDAAALRGGVFCHGQRHHAPRVKHGLVAPWPPTKITTAATACTTSLPPHICVHAYAQKYAHIYTCTHTHTHTHTAKQFSLLNFRGRFASGCRLLSSRCPRSSAGCTGNCTARTTSAPYSTLCEGASDGTAACAPDLYLDGAGLSFVRIMLVQR